MDTCRVGLQGGKRCTVSWVAVLLLAVGGLLWLHGATARAAGTPRYVSTTGSDNGGTNDCTNQASPCLTIANALTHATAGDTIQIGPGVFATSVTTAKAVTFAGAGAGTANSFDPTKDTAIDAAGTQQTGITINNRDVRIEGLRIRGGVLADGMGGHILPAVQSNGSGAATLNISDSILLQDELPPNPDMIDYALEADGVKTTVQDSTIGGYQDGIESSGSGGSLSVTNSSVITPTPATSGLFLQPVAAIWTQTPTTVTDSRLAGISGLDVEKTQANVLRTVILASGGGAVLLDVTGSTSMSIRDSVVDVVGDPSGHAVAAAVHSQVNSEPTPPVISLTGDTIFVRSAKTPAALDVSQAAAGTSVNVHNTILHAIDTSGHNAANDILAGNNAVNWNVGHSDYAEVAGQGVPAAGSGTNLNAPPNFVNDSGSNLRLSASSTLFDRGDATFVGASETDVTGAPRSVAHVCGGPALPDLGAFEAAALPCPPPPPPAPSLSQFSQSHKKWRTGSQAAALTASEHRKHKKKAPVGTTFRFTLNTPSAVSLNFTESAKGRKGKGGKCVAQTKRNKHKRSCKRTIPAGTLTFPTAAAGTDSISFAGKFANHKKLKAGKYTVTIEASNSSGHSTTSTLHFTVVKR
jgi:hypothetical protein